VNEVLISHSLNKCDANCPQNFTVRVRHRRDRSDLIFCGHHFDRFEAALIGQGFVKVYDSREEI